MRLTRSQLRVMNVTVTGQPGTDQKVNLTTPEGYKLAEGQTLPN
ncbi:hypothetical protein [Lactobacillus johnsonii]|nr:hypothetical protein [Lactobacillus johnsonii]